MKIYLRKIPSAESPNVCHSRRGESCYFAQQSEKYSKGKCPKNRDNGLKCYSGRSAGYIFIEDKTEEVR